jgi:hypothetical protein
VVVSSHIFCKLRGSHPLHNVGIGTAVEHVVVVCVVVTVAFTVLVSLFVMLCVCDTKTDCVAGVVIGAVVHVATTTSGQS